MPSIPKLRLIYCTKCGWVSSHNAAHVGMVNECPWCCNSLSFAECECELLTLVDELGFDIRFVEKM